MGWEKEDNTKDKTDIMFHYNDAFFKMNFIPRKQNLNEMCMWQEGENFYTPWDI